MEPQLLRAEEVAQVLSISRSKVFQMITAGELPVVRFGRSVRVPARLLQEWLAQRTAEQKGGYWPR